MKRVLVAAALAVLAGHAVADGPMKGTPARSSRAPALKEAVLAAASLFAVRPELRRDPEAVGRVASMEGVLVLFDDLNDPKALDALAAMSSYYLGEASGGTFRCVLVRKGSAIRGRLANLLKSGANECKQVYEKATDEVREAACLDDVAYKAKLNDVIGMIDRKERCDEL